MDPARIFQLITNSTLLATRLLTVGGGGGPLVFTQARYCVVVAEDTAPASSLATVKAIHRQGAEVRYTLTQTKVEAHFTINPASGVIFLAGTLDYELKDKHEFVVRSEGGGTEAHAIVRVVVADVNDNPPVFLRPQPHVTVIEEDDRDLPLPLAKVEAHDVDDVDAGRLLYTISGDGVDGFSSAEAYFTVNSRSGEVMQRKALDRDPPKGRGVWRLKVTVRDGQMVSSGPWETHSNLNTLASTRVKRLPRAAEGEATRLTQDSRQEKQTEVTAEEIKVKKLINVDYDDNNITNNNMTNNLALENRRTNKYSNSNVIKGPRHTTTSTTITTTTTATIPTITYKDEMENEKTFQDMKQDEDTVVRLNREELDSREHNSETEIRRRSHLGHNEAQEL